MGKASYSIAEADLDKIRLKYSSAHIEAILNNCQIFDPAINIF